MSSTNHIRWEDIKDISPNAINDGVPGNKEPILALLRDAGVTHVDARVVRILPDWSAVESQYGSEPVVNGLDRCHEFRSMKGDKFLAPAGLFNTGTNAMTYYLRANLQIGNNDTSHYGILTQVPWDKHWMYSLRYEHTIARHGMFDKDRVMPIVVIRDPLTWIRSMCRQPYLVRWIPKQARTHCPHTIVNGQTQPVAIPSMTNRTWQSLFHLWNDWYREYLDAPSPRLIVRVEDLWFRPRKVLEIIQKCTGAKQASEFFYVVASSKWEHVREHGPQSSWVSAIVKHGNPANRLLNLTSEDLAFAKTALDDELIRRFRYDVS